MKMFVAGPVNISKKLKKLIPYEEMGHREPEFEKLYKGVNDKLYKVFNISKKEFDFAIIGGSGTAAIESTISSVVNKKILVITNGAFGERAYEIARIYRLPRAVYKFAWGEYPDIIEIENILKNYPEIGFVYMVHMETSTGMLNPVKEVGILCKMYDKTFIVDSICAIGCEKLDMKYIDFCVFSSNKGLGGVPVVGMVCCRKSKLINLKKRNMYLDLSLYLKYDKKNQTPFTPAIPMFYMLNEILKDLLEEGVDNRIKRYKGNCDLLKYELTKLGLDFYLKDNMSNIMINVLIPKWIIYDIIHDNLKKKGFLIYPGKDELSGKVMHIATIGALTEKDIRNFIKVLSKILTYERGWEYE